jgi:hypothetical protein
MIAVESVAVKSIRQSGAEYGQDLAAAMIVAGKGLDRDQKRRMSQLVVREIAAAVQNLRDAGIPATAVESFERACREACRDELLRAVETERGHERAA